MTQYDYRIDLDDLNATHVRQLRLIGHGKSVLELGCASGAMTKLIRAQDNRVTGVEFDPGEAEKAREFADRVYVANLEAPDALDELGDAKFDVVLAGDVLEHLRDPLPILTKIGTMLKDDGYIVVSIPNVGHGSLRLSLLQGRWDYADYGLLDRTHLKFFTHSSLMELVDEAGLRVEHLERVKMSPFDLDPLLNLNDFPTSVVEMIADDPESATLQFVFAAVPKERPEGRLHVEPEPDWDTVEVKDKDKPKKKTKAVTRPVAAPSGDHPQIEGVRAVAFYLPQFHPTTENDAWWGKGFTEWTNVTKAEPVYPGHYQPRLPADLGFYDLRLPEVRAAQAKLARENGISAFIYHHYWFGGRRLLNRPFDEVMASGQPNFPFALCWANEPWSRIWDGGDRSILVDQVYEGDELRKHAALLAKPFNDPRYLKVDGKPLFVIYRITHLTDSRAYLDEFRKACLEESGVEPYIVQAITHDLDKKPSQTGADAEVEFPPHRMGDKIKAHPDPRLAAGSHQRYEYEDVVAGCLERLDVPWVRYPGVVPSWDNTARRKVRATILHGANPEAYEKWLLAAAESEARRRPEDGLVFINAWNEWAEGAYLEPDQKFGTGYLEATRRVFGQIPEPKTAPKTDATQAVGALPADYLELRERVVQLEEEVTSAYDRGQKASRAADRKQANAHTREVARLHQAIADITVGARQTAEWAKNLDKQVKEKAEAMDEIGHWARSMEVEVENKNRAIADGASYARKLETEVAEKNRQIAEGAGYARQLEAELAKKDRHIEELTARLRDTRK